MKPIFSIGRSVAIIALLLIGLTVGTSSGADNNRMGLTWNVYTNSYSAKTGETKVTMLFWFTNQSSTPITINRIEASCGCTTAQKPIDPWIIKAGHIGNLPVVVDFKGKFGTLHKRLMVDTSAGLALLTVNVEIPESPNGKPQDRARNLIAALSNRQALFQGDCARCHSKPAVGLVGKELYIAVCGICHEGEHRASMVPDLRSLKTPTDAAYWRQWIVVGREGSLMPAFNEKQGGPLNEIQIRSLVDYLEQEYKRPLIKDSSKSK